MVTTEHIKLHVCAKPMHLSVCTSSNLSTCEQKATNLTMGAFLCTTYISTTTGPKHAQILQPWPSNVAGMSLTSKGLCVYLPVTEQGILDCSWFQCLQALGTMTG